jgi:phage gpG-like protein
MANKIIIRSDAAALRAALANLKASLKDLRVPYTAIGDHFKLTTYERFAKEISPSGVRWAPNADATLLAYIQKKTRGKGLSKKRTSTGGRTLTKGGSRALGIKKILRYSGNLQDLMVTQITKNKLMFGAHQVTKAYAQTQQFGRPAGKNGKGAIPARPFIGVTPNDVQAIQDIVAKYLSTNP